MVHVGEDDLTYDLGHIPGAASLVWDFWGTRPADRLDGPGVGALLSSLSVGPDTRVVLYSDQANVWTAYAAWLLRYWGHPHVALLDGGYQMWAASGRPMVAARPALPATTYPTPRVTQPRMRVELGEVATMVGSSDAVLVDARIEGEYRGEVVAELADRPAQPHRRGRIPGAVNVPWTSLVDPDTGLLRPPSVLRSTYEAAGVRWDRPVVSYCLMGAGSALTFLVLADHLDHPDVRNYDRSWLEWSERADLPIVS